MRFHTNQIMHPTSFTLQVSNLEQSKHFYTEILGLSILNEKPKSLTLSANKKDVLIELIEDHQSLNHPYTLGLYHFALLVSSPSGLANLFKHLFEKKYPLIGASDHGVSEAIYLEDPDGNGIEVYYDKDESLWPMKNGTIEMFTHAMNIPNLLSHQTEKFKHIDPKTILGHLHFYVDSIATAKAFFVDILGFQIVQNYMGSALFISDNHYHHHIGLNIWQQDAPKRNHETGLLSYTIHVPAKMKQALLDRIAVNNIPLHSEKDRIYLWDPYQQKVFLQFGDD